MLLSLLSLTSKWLFRLAWSESQLKKTIVRFSFSEFRGVKDELFTKIFNDWKSTIFAKRSILDVWQGFDYAAGQDKKYIRTQIVDWNFLKTGRVTFLITPGHVHSVFLVIVANYFNTTLQFPKNIWGANIWIYALSFSLCFLRNGKVNWSNLELVYL